jgi:DNA invertase Pin-like site-specific DNA recombinase
MKVGYARVSTGDQNLDLQRDALTAAGCEFIHEDRQSGAVNGAGRKGLADALAGCGAGDVLVVWKLDRLGRSLFDLVELVETLKDKGAGLKVLTGHGATIDTTTGNGRLIFGIFTALAEFERELIRERTRAGMAAAKRRGKHVGRPRALTEAQVRHAMAMVESGRQSISSMAELFECDRKTVERALKRAGSTGGSAHA